MKQILSLLVLACTISFSSFAQEVSVENAKFHAGDNMSWADANLVSLSCDHPEELAREIRPQGDRRFQYGQDR